MAPRAATLAILTAALLVTLGQTAPTSSPATTAPAAITNSLGMKFVPIPAGEFLMGFATGEPGYSPDQPPRKIRISKPFYLQTTEVTQKQFAAFNQPNDSAFKGDTQPVERVSWDDAVDFCKQLSAKEHKTYRLPTEAEWEYACRAGTTTAFSFGNTISTDIANYDGTFTFADSPKGPYRAKTTTVASFKPNPWGLFDMHGNVAEWCLDWEGDYPKGDATDPTGPADGTQRVMRGGSYLGEPADCRSAARDWYDPEGRRDSRGFRVLLEIETK